MELFLKLIFITIIMGLFFIILIGLVDTVVVKLDKTHPFRQWWEKHFILHLDKDDNRFD